MLRYITAGESHGKALTALIDGFPAGVEINLEQIDVELRRRRGGYGRGGRQRIENDGVEILGGLRRGKTVGGPIALMIPNRDYRIDRLEEAACPRPGHGDLSGSIKFLGSICDVSERASARETAARTAAGALVRQLFPHFGVEAFGYVTQVGPIVVHSLPGTTGRQRAARDRSELYTLNPGQDAEIKAAIDEAEKQGDTLGGVVEVRVEGVPFGLGSHARWDERLDGRLARAVMSVPAIKGVEIGLGFEAARRPGSRVHDPINYDPALAGTPSLGFTRPTNNAGGIEAGMSNSQPIVLRAALKPICTLNDPLDSVDLTTMRSAPAARPRSDVCVVAAASCIVENVAAFEIAGAMIDKFGGDSLTEMLARWRLFHELSRSKLGGQGGIIR